MNRSTYLAAGAIVASLALPAAASAATPTSIANVRADVKASAKAFGKVDVLTEAGRDRAAAAKLKLGTRELRSAARITARMRRNADSSRELRRLVRAERMVGVSAATSAGTLADVVVEADASADVNMAGTISTLLTIHETALDALTATLDIASVAVDAVVVKAIAQLNAAAETAVSAISGVLATVGDVSAQATLVLNSALQLVTQTVSTSLGVLQALSGEVSGDAQASVNTALGQVTAALVQVQSTLQGLVGTLVGAGTQAVGAIVLPTLANLLGSLKRRAVG